MTADQFTYWLQGFAELNTTAPSDEQWQSIREHLATVFTKVTATMADPIDPSRVLPIGREINDMLRRQQQNAVRYSDVQPLRTEC